MSLAPIDMSLRLWSDEVALAPVLFRLGSSGIVHVRGEPVPLSKGAAPRIAPRHFASIAREKAWRASDIDAWMGPLLVKMRSDRSLMSLIEMSQIEGTFWIAVLGARLVPMPEIDRRLLNEVVSVGLTIFLENYTELREGNPTRLWFPKKPEPTAYMQSARS